MRTIKFTDEYIRLCAKEIKRQIAEKNRQCALIFSRSRAKFCIMGRDHKVVQQMLDDISNDKVLAFYTTDVPVEYIEADMREYINTRGSM